MVAKRSFTNAVAMWSGLIVCLHLCLLRLHPCLCVCLCLGLRLGPCLCLGLCLGLCLSLCLHARCHACGGDGTHATMCSCTHTGPHAHAHAHHHALPKPWHRRHAKPARTKRRRVQRRHVMAHSAKHH